MLHVVPIGPGGELGPAQTLPLTGDFVSMTGFNLNGIEASPDGRTLLVVQSNTGLPFAKRSPLTGATTQVDLGGASLTNGDGLLRRANTLYVVRNRLNEIAVIELDASYESGTLTGTITDPDFQVPTTVAAFGPYLYAVNARFGTTPTPDTTYTVVRVARDLRRRPRPSTGPPAQADGGSPSRLIKQRAGRSRRCGYRCLDSPPRSRSLKFDLGSVSSGQRWAEMGTEDIPHHAIPPSAAAAMILLPTFVGTQAHG